MKQRVKFAYPYEDAEGKTYRQGAEHDVDSGLASKLVNSGFAARVTETAKATPAKKEA